MRSALKLFFTASIAIACVSLAFADNFTEDFFTVSDANEHSREIWYEYKGATNGAPTYVFLNGLTYDTRFWRQTSEEILRQNPDAGILRFDFWGMGTTLLNGVPGAPWRNYEDVPAIRQAQDYIRLVKGLHISGPIISVGLSYGGGIALIAETLDPKLSKETILVAPYMEPAHDQDVWIKDQIKLFRLMSPFNPVTDDQLYDGYLYQSIFATYPSLEPIVLENPWKLQAVFKLVAGIRRTYATDLLAQIPKSKKIHLVQPLKDEYIPADVFERFWNAVPKKQKGSLLRLATGRHKMPEDQPVALATWIARIAHDPATYHDGRTWELSPDELTGCENNFLKK